MRIGVYTDPEVETIMEGRVRMSEWLILVGQGAEEENVTYHSGFGLCWLRWGSFISNFFGNDD